MTGKHRPADAVTFPQVGQNIPNVTVVENGFNITLLEGMGDNEEHNFTSPAEEYWM